MVHLATFKIRFNKYTFFARSRCIIGSVYANQARQQTHTGASDYCGTLITLALSSWSSVGLLMLILPSGLPA